MNEKFAINGIHISWCNVKFKCPHCTYPYSDDRDNYLNRCNKNKTGWTKVKCIGCKRLFGMAYNFMGDAQSFEL